MRILITGATGLIGSEIVRLCHTQGYAVNYLTTSRDKIVSQENYKGFFWNPGTGEIDLDCFTGVQAVINLAGASISKRWTPAYKKKIISSRIRTLATLYDALGKIGDNKIISFVSASAIGIYPDSISKYYTEDDKEVDQSFLGEVVEAWEKEMDRFASFDFPLAKIRVGLVMANNGGALPKMAFPIKNFVGAAFGSGQQWQSWIHVGDLARIFLFAVENGLSGIYNAVAPNPVSNTKLVREIAKVLNRPLLLPNIPKFALKTLLGEMSYLLFASQRVSSKKMEKAGFVFDYGNVCRALEQIYGLGDEQNSPKNLVQDRLLP